MNVMRNEFLSKQKRIKSQRQRNLRNFFPGYYTVSNIVPSFNCFNMPKANNRNDNNLDFLPHEESDTQENETDTLDTFKEQLQISNVEQRTGKDSTGSTSLEFRKLLEPFGNFRGDSETSGNCDKYFSKTNSEIAFTKHEEDDILDSVFKKPRYSPTRTNEGAHTSSDILPNDSISFSATSLHQSLFDPVPFNYRRSPELRWLTKRLEIELNYLQGKL